MAVNMNLFVVMLILCLRDFLVCGNNDSVFRKKVECPSAPVVCSNSDQAPAPVCGSDNVTYSSECEIISKQCRGEDIYVKQPGACPGTPPCHRLRMSTVRPEDRPTCHPDGTYAPVQCHQKTGYCWCVTPQGQPVANTSVKNRKPKCLQSSVNNSSSGFAGDLSTRSGQKRRSPTPPQKRQFTHKHRNTCDHDEKLKFNANLFDKFNIEFKRTNISQIDEKNIDQVLSWKFVSLDKNADGFLDKDEYKELRRLAKKAVRPKKCARTFAKTCDINHDLKLSQSEWKDCIANDLTPQEEEEIEQEMPPAPVYTRPNFSEDPPDTKEESDANDCISDRRSVMEEQKDKEFYIPQCTPDGRYNKIQCYAGYCWCVYQDSGKPIPGTAAQNHAPNCNPAPSGARPMKGCPEEKKEIFLKNLMDQMEDMMKSSQAGSVEATNTWPMSKEESIATWHFVMLDTNKNKILERKEWKSFRTMVANNRQLKRCGKKLPRYCDVNNDRRISMTEWLSCLNAQRPSQVYPVQSPSTNAPKRIGPNPLETFLNDDD